MKYYILLNGGILAETLPPRPNSPDKTPYIRTTLHKGWALGLRTKKEALAIGETLNRNYSIKKL